jgi:hypothetical protein
MELKFHYCAHYRSLNSCIMYDRNLLFCATETQSRDELSSLQLFGPKCVRSPQKYANLQCSLCVVTFLYVVPREQACYNQTSFDEIRSDLSSMIGCFMNSFS